MRRKSLRWLSLSVVLLALVTLAPAPAAQALPRAWSMGSGSFVAWVWSHLAGLWQKEGSIMDPNGHTVPHGVLGDEGVDMDPNGRH